MSYKRYSEEFKHNVVCEAKDSARSIPQVVHQIRAGTDKPQPNTNDSAEIRRLQKELKRVIEERDIFEKAAIYFSNQLS